MRESENCSHNCRECGSDCAERTEPQSFLEEPNARTHVKKVIGIVSGKGGVGKSLVTSLLASAMQKKGYQGIAGKMLQMKIEKYKDYLYIEGMPEERKNADFYMQFGFHVMADGVAMQKCNFDNKV